MPLKTGLLGTLSRIALSAGLAFGSSVVASAQNQQTFVELCSWIDQQTEVATLQSIIDRLSQNDQECIFDPTAGQNYCKACLTLAALKVVELTATAGPRDDDDRDDPSPYG